MTGIPRPEHPRPEMQRSHWLSLNGSWRFRFDPDNIGQNFTQQIRWHRPQSGPAKDLTIMVPYPWESRLSGVAAPDYKGAAWYEREITIPREWQGYRPFLRFEAVDWHTRVWVNGRIVAEHNNGYLPFACDLSPHIEPGQTATVTVRAYDIADPANPVGKQAPRWYTNTSGIWQTVWLEARPPSHIDRMEITPDLARQQVSLRLVLSVDTPGDYQVRVQSDDSGFSAVEQKLTLNAGYQEVALMLHLPEPQLWSPESPHLYYFTAELIPSSGHGDQVQSYFGMRSIERAGWDGKAYEYILLNGEPVYLRGALDQAFHPDGIYAYPSDEVIRDDIQLAKDMGLNMLRCHVKLNEPRYYYWADRMGLLIMYDIPNPDIDTPQMRRVWEETMRGAIQRDYNHPSIFAWVLFNETWGLENHDTAEGQAWVRSMYQLAKELDPSRLVEDNSPNKYDHVETDINSWHYYLNSYEQVRKHIEQVVDATHPGSAFNYVGEPYVQATAPLMNSEYAGVSARMGDQDIAWSFKYHTTEMRRHDPICGYVYTELTDVEWEHNGFANYDRSPKEFGYDAFVPGMSVRDLNSADMIGFDAPPCQTIAPGAHWQAPIFVSHWGLPLQNAKMRWQVDFVDEWGQTETVSRGDMQVELTRFAVSHFDPLDVTFPNRPGLATVTLWLMDGAQEIRCRNYVNVEVRANSVPAVERTEKGWLLRIRPGTFRRSSWGRPIMEPDGDKVSATGSGWFEYEVPLPQDVAPAALQNVRLQFEASAQSGLYKIDWPQQLGTFNYPQTEPQRRYPSDLVVTVNGEPFKGIRLPDDPADARGVLSHHRGIDPGSYGERYDLVLDSDRLPGVQRALQTEPLRIRFTIPDDAEHAGGIALYGDTVGRYPSGIRMILQVSP